MIDFTDLFRGLNNIDILTIEQNVQTILLRHNSALRSWYRFFATKYEAYLNENTFALNFEGFWKIIRDVLQLLYLFIIIIFYYKNIGKAIKSEFHIGNPKSIILFRDEKCISIKLRLKKIKQGVKFYQTKYDEN